MNSFTKVSSLLMNTAQKYHMVAQVSGSLIQVAFYNLCRDIFRDVHLDPVSLLSQVTFSRGTLRVSTYNAAVANELSLRRSDIIDNLNDQLSEKKIKRIIISIS